MNPRYALQDRFLKEYFSSQFKSDFYLTGGTALARFYFHHRESVDLDLFTNNQSIDMSEVNFTINAIGKKLNLSVTKQVIAESFIQYIWESTGGIMLKVDAVKDVYVRFGQLQKRNKISIDSLENIGSNKILAVFGRTDAKDFIDLYMILHEAKFTFEHLFSLAKQKDLGLTEFYLANSLRQISTITLIPPTAKNLEWGKIKAYFQKRAKTLVSSIKPEG